MDKNIRNITIQYLQLINKYKKTVYFYTIHCLIILTQNIL